MTPEDRIRQLDHRTDAILSQFDTTLASTLSHAKLKTVIRLRQSLDVTPGGEVMRTAANLRKVRALPQIFKQAMVEAGYNNLISHFASSFDGGLPTFESILSDLTDDYQIKPVEFSDADLAYFQQVKETTAINLSDAVDRVGQLARQNVMLTVAGNPFEATAVLLAERLHIALGEASTLAATGISTFYRTVADRGYEIVEDALGLKGKRLEYTYYGPPAGDRLIRPFCRRLMQMAAGGRTWTRAQIDGMDNGQLPDCFRTGGGFNCRHQWVVALEH